MVDKNKILIIATLVFLTIFFFLVLYKLHGPSLLDMESIFMGKIVSRQSQ
jgi:uncharacterized membrane protein